MKKYLLVLTLSICCLATQAQWQTTNQLSDLNTWSSLPGFIGWYGLTANTPPTPSGYGSGIQMLLPVDNRFGAQLVVPTFDDNIFYRNNLNGTWTPWYKVWSSYNFDPDNYLDRSVPCISTSGSVNTFLNGYTFAYTGSGAPWNGSLISYGGFGGNYDTQINSDYGPHGGNHMSFRTRNGDINSWNTWNEIYHSGNFNKSDVDFTARTINSTSVYNNGNLWSKQIVVAMTNPWPDFVFNKQYILTSLSDLKTYIDKNHHLPEIPAAADVEKDGVNLGEMNKILVKKVEELTLYLIEQNKQIKNANNRIDELQTQIQAIKK